MSIEIAWIVQGQRIILWSTDSQIFVVYLELGDKNAVVKEIKGAVQAERHPEDKHKENSLWLVLSSCPVCFIRIFQYAVGKIEWVCRSHYQKSVTAPQTRDVSIQNYQKIKNVENVLSKLFTWVDYRCVCACMFRRCLSEHSRVVFIPARDVHARCEHSITIIENLTFPSWRSQQKYSGDVYMPLCLTNSCYQLC